MNEPSFTASFWEAEKIVEITKDLPDYAYRVGYTWSHRKPHEFEILSSQEMVRRFFDPDAIRESVTETVHHSILYCYTALIPALFNFYLYENLIGGEANPLWAWRPSIFWTYCAECKTLFWARKEANYFSLCGGVFPMEYFPGEEIINRVRWLLTDTYKNGLVLENTERTRWQR